MDESADMVDSAVEPPVIDLLKEKLELPVAPPPSPDVKPVSVLEEHPSQVHSLPMEPASLPAGLGPFVRGGWKTRVRRAYDRRD